MNPALTTRIEVGRTDVYVDASRITDRAALADESSEGLKRLAAALREAREFQQRQPPFVQRRVFGNVITILADRETPYASLQRVLAVARDAGFTRPELAVVHQER